MSQPIPVHRETVLDRVLHYWNQGHDEFKISILFMSRGIAISPRIIREAIEKHLQKTPRSCPHNNNNAYPQNMPAQIAGAQDTRSYTELAFIGGGGRTAEEEASLAMDLEAAMLLQSLSRTDEEIAAEWTSKGMDMTAKKVRVALEKGFGALETAEEAARLPSMVVVQPQDVNNRITVCGVCGSLGMLGDCRTCQLRGTLRGDRR